MTTRGDFAYAVIRCKEEPGTMVHVPGSPYFLQRIDLTAERALQWRLLYGTSPRVGANFIEDIWSYLEYIGHGKKS